MQKCDARIDRKGQNRICDGLFGEAAAVDLALPFVQGYARVRPVLLVPKRVATFVGLSGITEAGDRNNPGIAQKGAQKSFPDRIYAVK
jgi:hypothetical protein